MRRAKLSPAQKKVMDEHCSSDWALKIATPWADYESGGNAKIKALPGHEVYPLTPEKREDQRNPVPYWVGWREKCGLMRGNRQQSLVFIA